MTKSQRETPSTFNEDLLRLNNLTHISFDSWSILPGMGYNDPTKWWGSHGMRVSPHEGIDLCTFIDLKGKFHSLKSGMLVPVVHSGKVVSVINDFLAETVVVSHDYHDSTGRMLHSFYAHIDPGPMIEHGKALSTGEAIGKIALPAEPSKCPAHLHLSMAWMSSRVPKENICWENFSKDKHVLPVDPLTVISLKES